MSPNLAIPYFLDADADRPRGGRSLNHRVSRRDAKRAIDVASVVVVSSTKVEPYHHHAHRGGGGLPVVWNHVRTIRQGSGVACHA